MQRLKYELFKAQFETLDLHAFVHEEITPVHACN